jgi:hypothetical protein
MNETDRALCACTAAWLDAWLRAALLSPALSAASAVALFALQPLPRSATALLAACVAAFLLDRWWVLRLRFDAQLFARLADGRIPSLAALDEGLAALRLRRPAASPRPLADRIAGTRALQRRHALLCIAQVAALAAGAARALISQLA